MSNAVESEDGAVVITTEVERHVIETPIAQQVPGTGGSGGGLYSFMGRTTPAAALFSADVLTALGFTPISAAAVTWAALPDKPTIPSTYGDVGAASAAQGAKADAAVPSATYTAGMNTKVDKAAGYGLSKNDLTDARAAKLDAMPEDHFKGVHVGELELAAARPTGIGGDYADVDPGTGVDAIRYIFDPSDNKWVKGGATTSYTAAQILGLYEANPNRNAFTDAFKTKLTDIATGATKNSNTDELQESATPTNKWFTTARVLATALSGLSVATAGDVVATDSILVAIGKIQRKWNDLSTTLAGLVTSIGTKVDKVDGYGLSQANYTATEKTKLAGMGPWGSYLSAQSVRPSNGSTAATVLGVAISSGGTASHPTLDQTSLLNAVRRIRFTGGTAAAVQIGVHETALTKTRGGSAGMGGFHVEITFGQATNVTGHQVFAGIAAATALLGSDPSAVANTIGLGYDAADDASGNWYLIHNDGSGTAAKDDVGVPRNTTDLLRLTLHATANGAGIEATVRNLTTGVTVFSATVTTKLPVSTAFMGMRVVGRNGSLGNSQILEVVSMEAGYQE